MIDMLDVNIHKTNKVVLALKRKKAKAAPSNGKKVITRLCEKPGSGKRRCFGPRNSKIVYQKSRLSTIPTFNMIKANPSDNRGKMSRTSQRICESKK